MDWLIKIGIALAVIAAVGYGVHSYNEGLREEGKTACETAQKAAVAAAKEEWDKERKTLEGQRRTLQRQYEAERDARRAMERQFGQEREDAIHDSGGVADTVCFTPRLRDNWNAVSGRKAGAGAAGGSVDKKVPAGTQ